MSILAERMNALKEKHDTKYKSDDKTATPLTAFLCIYSKAQKECFIDYMEGATLLISYLSPISLPLNYTTSESKLPSVLISYEATQLAMLLAVDSYNLKEVRHL